MSWLQGLAPAVIYLDMKSARMNTIGLTVSRTQEISGTFFFFFFLPLMNCSLSWLPFRRTFMNVNETERRAAKRTSLHFNLILTRFDVSLQNQFLSGSLPPESTLNKLLFNTWFVLIFPQWMGEEICTGQTPAEPLWLLPGDVDSDYWCKTLQCCFQFVHCLFKTLWIHAVCTFQWLQQAMRHQKWQRKSFIDSFWYKLL